MMNRTSVAAIALVLLTWASGGVTAQQIRGRVVDQQTRQGIRGAAVTLLSADSAVVTRAETNNEGFFVLEASAAGSYAIDVQSVGHAPNRRPIELTDAGLTVPAFVLQSQTIQLDSVAVEVDRNIDPTAVGFARASHISTGARLATLEQQAVTFTSALRELGGGVRVREYLGSGGQQVICIESTRRLAAMSGRGGQSCDMVAFIIDGIPIGTPTASDLRSYHLDQFESIEYFTPVEAGTRFGLQASSVGAIVLWTRGRGPHVSKERGGG